MNAEAQEIYNLMPLHFFYARDGREMPVFRFIPGQEIPEPERELLVHDTDMTPRLSSFHQSRLVLRVWESELQDAYLLRLVLLETEKGRRPVEFGAIGIDLDKFAAPVRRLIEQGQEPLGGILERFEVPHRGNPRAFFSVEADDLVSEALGGSAGDLLYGRCNQLIDPDGLVLADVVEILPGKGGPGQVSRA
ncbi:MAG: hypothetical protein ACC661_12140 [Verrucomicrobiales bacterium]